MDLDDGARHARTTRLCSGVLGRRPGMAGAKGARRARTELLEGAWCGAPGRRRRENGLGAFHWHAACRPRAKACSTGHDSPQHVWTASCAACACLCVRIHGSVTARVTVLGDAAGCRRTLGGRLDARHRRSRPSRTALCSRRSRLRRVRHGQRWGLGARKRPTFRLIYPYKVDAGEKAADTTKAGEYDDWQRFA